MDIEQIPVECWQITGAPALDTIQVFWLDFEPGRGHVTIACYGQAWTAYFGAMGGKTIREFFAACSVGYLVNKLSRIKENNLKYLGDIIGELYT